MAQGTNGEDELERKFLLCNVPRFAPRKGNLVSTIDQGWIPEVAAGGAPYGISLTSTHLVLPDVRLELPTWTAKHLAWSGAKLRFRREVPNLRSLPTQFTVNTKRAAGTAGKLEEWERGIPQSTFDAVYPRIGLRLTKVRRRVTLDQDIQLPDCKEAACDVFGLNLEGLVVMEVEFTTLMQMHAFVAPSSWSRYRPREVTVDPRFTNAALASLSTSQARALYHEFYPTS